MNFLNLNLHKPIPKEAFAGYSFSAPMLSGICFLLDSLAILLSGVFSYFAIIGTTYGNVSIYASAVVFVFLATCLLFQYFGLYKFEAIMKPVDFLNKLCIAYALPFLAFLAIAFSLKVSSDYSRIWMYVFAFSGGLSIFFLRLVCNYLVKKLVANGQYVRKVVVIGSGKQGQRLLNYIAQSGPQYMSVIGVFDARKRVALKHVNGHPILGGIDELMAFVRANRVDDVIIALPWSAEEHLKAIVEKIVELPINVFLSSDLAGFSLKFNASPSHYNDFPMVEIVNKPLSDWDIVFKYVEDMVLAGIALVLLAPLMLGIALAVRLSSPGPVLFRQKRLGFNNKEFVVYKFRSMYVSPQSEVKTIQAKRMDSRITAVGRFIRRTSLDELPQLFNVLGSTMSLVGPRPHAIDHNEEYSRQIFGYFARHRVKPGITGWAQVNGLRGETEVLSKMEDRIKYDHYYVENWSIMFDLKILIMTIYVVLFTRDAY